MIEGYLLNLISQNQSSFVKRRNINNNVLLVQEVIFYIRIKDKNDNAVIKLDMEKSYDRVGWSCLRF